MGANPLGRGVLATVRRAAAAELLRRTKGEVEVAWFLVGVNASLKDAFPDREESGAKLAR